MLAITAPADNAATSSQSIVVSGTADDLGTPSSGVALVTVGLCGGLAHILLTESYRLAPASVVAPFDYTAMVWAFLLGYFFFNELPTIFVFAGAGIIAGAGLFVIWRERQLGLQRVRAAEGPPTGT